MSPSVDPITVSVIHHRLVAIVEEMGEAMLRTSYSQILNSSRDFSAAICDTASRLVAQAEHIPVHIGALPEAVRAVGKRFEGPYRAGRHLSAQRSLSRRQPPARRDGLRAGLCARWGSAVVLDRDPGSPQRHRRRHPRRLQRQGDRDLAGRDPNTAVAALRSGRAARGLARDARRERPAPAGFPGRPLGHDRIGAGGRATTRPPPRGVSRGSGDGGGGWDPRRGGASGACRVRDLGRRNLPRRGGCWTTTAAATRTFTFGPR